MAITTKDIIIIILEPTFPKVFSKESPTIEPITPPPLRFMESLYMYFRVAIRLLPFISEKKNT